MSLNSNRSDLDQQQILQRAFDETTDALRTNAVVVTEAPGTVEVVIDHTTDSIQAYLFDENGVAFSNGNPLPVSLSTPLDVTVVNENTNGQKTMANSQPVVIASDQSSIPVTGTFFQATQPVSAISLPLPTGASTSALQTTGNTSLSSIDSKTPSLGQSAMSGSIPVTIASDQSAISVNISNTPSVSIYGVTSVFGSQITLEGLIDSSTTGVFTSALDVNGYINFQLFSKTTSTIIGTQIVTLQINPTRNDEDFWISTSLTVTPSLSVGAVTTSSSVIVARRARLSIATPITSGNADIILLVGSDG